MSQVSCYKLFHIFQVIDAFPLDIVVGNLHIGADGIANGFSGSWPAFSLSKHAVFSYLSFGD